MRLVKIRSQKHPGAIFLKIDGTKDDFLCKIYPSDEAELISNTIIEAFSEDSKQSFLNNKEEDLKEKLNNFISSLSSYVENKIEEEFRHRDCEGSWIVDCISPLINLRDSLYELFGIDSTEDE